MKSARVRLAREHRATLLLVAMATWAMVWGGGLARSACADGYPYLSPSPGARYVSPANTVVIREGRVLDPASATHGLVSVVGAVSGLHDGALSVASDGRTLVFRPAVPFALGETVHVTLHPGLQGADGSALPPVDFAFEIGHVNPRDQLAVLAQLDDEAGGQAEAIPPLATADPTCTALPSGFPAFNIRASNDPDPGSLFLSPYSGFQSGNITIIDNVGQPLFFRHFPDVIHDFVPQPNGLLTYFETAPKSGTPKFFALDHTFALVDSFETGNGYVPDTHELLLLPNGHFLIMAYDPQPVRMDLVVPGGDPDATVVGLVIQELDADRNVVFQWRSWDHVDITDAVGVNFTSSTIDAVHGNALEVTPDGNILLCSRNLCELTKIDRQTGDVLWRMGPHAKKNQFTFVNDPRGFGYQHDARWLPNGHLTLFDDGYGTPAYSRMVEYAVDETNRIATEVMEWVHSPRISTSAMGSTRRLPSGKTLIGWGGAYSFAKLTEIRPDGSVALELGADATVTSYRVIRSSWRNGVLVTNDALDMGVANPGQTVVRPMSVRNGGSASVTIGCAISSDPQFAVTTPMPVTIAPGAEVALDVSFTPAATGLRSGKLYLRVPGATQFVAQDIAVTGVGNRPPDGSQAYATPRTLWPPNHALVPISIQGVIDPEGEPLTITATGVLQDEALDGVGDGSTCPDAEIVDGAARVRAERSALGAMGMPDNDGYENGRLYDISFHAEDPHGLGCDGWVSVSVPLDAPLPLPAPLAARKDPGDPGKPSPPAEKGPPGEYVSALGPCPSQLDGESNADLVTPLVHLVSWTFRLEGAGVAGRLAAVEYTLAAEGDARLEVIDLAGRKVATLLHGHQTAGPHRISWTTSGLSPGVYFYRLRAGAASVSRIVRIIR